MPRSVRSVDVDPVAEIPAETVEFPHDRGVFVAQGFEAGGQLGPVLFLPGGLVFVEGVRGVVGGQERVALADQTLKERSGAPSLREVRAGKPSLFMAQRRPAMGDRRAFQRPRYGDPVWTSS